MIDKTDRIMSQSFYSYSHAGLLEYPGACELCKFITVKLGIFVEIQKFKFSKNIEILTLENISMVLKHI